MIRFFQKRNICQEKIKDLIEQKENLLFLDYDGVVNTSGKDGVKIFNRNCIRHLNKLCKKYDFRIVVSSSWKHYYNYKSILYHAGLDPDIPIEGKTEDLKNREEEILKYVQEHPNLSDFLIIDDDFIPNMEGHLVQTMSDVGLDSKKYHEAIALFKRLKNGK